MNVQPLSIRPVAPRAPGLTLLIHLYYPGSWAILQDKCAYVLRESSRIVITACHDDVILETGYSEKTTILKVTNQGKDVGGKLAALSYYLRFCTRTEFIALIHDKISPQTINAGYWLEKLYGIFEEHCFARAMRAFKKDPKTGVIGSKAFLKNEYVRSTRQFACTNDKILRQMILDHRLTCKAHNFIAGTIFIVRSRIFETFFTSYSPLEARGRLEPGNVLDLEQGTFTHSWERLFCFIAEDQGYSVKGI